jgi:hypothetical protein
LSTATAAVGAQTPPVQVMFCVGEADIVTSASASETPVATPMAAITRNFKVRVPAAVRDSPRKNVPMSLRSF